MSTHAKPHIEPFDPDGLRERRLALGLTQAELADRAGCTRNALSRWELGQRVPGPFARLRLDAALKSAVEPSYALTAAELASLRSILDALAVAGHPIVSRHGVIHPFDVAALARFRKDTTS